MNYNKVFREIHASPNPNGSRNFKCKHCYAYKTTKRNMPKKCDICGVTV